ncbi:methylaspartate mutase [Saccharothrix lopnurensis]|uniref:Methylaspartate mutase n=1 Tax=Saccharothrix lopnurensis TaxID=1670621 RepID=A0ABW1NWP0_9PSEU
MAEVPGLSLAHEVAAALPPWSEVLERLAAPGRRRVADVLADAGAAGVPVTQPRCGIGAHDGMVDLLRTLERAGPGILTITIDSHTRLRDFATAARLAAGSPADLNGYPLVAHGWRRGRELVASVGVPLQVRHGSPDPRDLFAVALAAGITSFEGGPIGYNLPYAKDVPLAVSLRAWREVDQVCGLLAEHGVVVDRELFGTLTAVLVPPSTSIAMTLLEAVGAVEAGVRCLSVSYPQGGETHQDVAALRAIRSLARRYLGVEVHAVLHQYMGPFPRSRPAASALIVQGGLVARLGGAAKVVTKTEQEAEGIPDARANADGLALAALGAADLFGFARLDEDRVAEEQHWIEREVADLVDPVLQGPDLARGIEAAFAAGRLDVPFSASRHARAEVVPRRDPSGAIRYGDSARLPFSDPVRRRNAALLGPGDDRSVFAATSADIHYFQQDRGMVPR